jgi:hypothetical protein
MQTQVLINGVDVTASLVNYELENTYGDANTQVTFDFVRNINNSVTLITGQTVTIYRGWITPTDELIFQGYIEKISPENGKVQIIALDKLWDLVRKEVTHVYDSTVDPSAGKISAIFLDLVTTYGGLNADGTTVQDSGTTITIQKFVCNHTDIMERCQALADILDWQFYYRSDTDKVYFEPKGYTSNSNILTVGGNIIKIPKWNYDITQMINDVTIIGAYQEVQTTELGQIGVTSGYTTTGILLTQTPISTKVYGDASNPPTTLKLGGVVNSTSTYDYYVDVNQKSIFPKPSTTFTSNNYFQIQYTYAAPIPVHMTNAPSISTYGQFKKTISYTDIRTVSDAIARGNNLLFQYSTPFIFSTIQVKNSSTYHLAAGQLIQVIDNISSPNVNEQLFISRHRIRYPNDYDELDVGDQIWRLAEWTTSIEEKIKRINEDLSQNQDIVTELVTFDDTTNNLKLNPRYNLIQTQTNDGTTMIWGNPDYSNWNSFKWGANAFPVAPATVYIQQYKDTYQEFFYDTDMKTTGIVGYLANWDTTNKQLVFSATGSYPKYMKMGPLAMGITYNYVTVTLNYTGTLGTIQVSYDGTNYTTVSNGVRTKITPTNTTGVYLQLTQNGKHAWTILNTYNPDGTRNKSGINMLMEV